MPLKIRCPRCNDVLIVDDASAGQYRPCSVCGAMLSVPVPARAVEPEAAPSPPAVASSCPRCGSDVAPGTTFCKHCYRDLATGRRIPLARRLRLMPLRVWLTLLLVGGGLPVIAAVAVSLYLNRRARPADDVPFVPVTTQPVNLEQYALELLGASSAEQRRSAVARLQPAGVRAARAVLGALRSTDAPGAAAAREFRRNQAAAMRFVGRFGDAGCAAELLDRAWPAPLDEEALLAAALLGEGGRLRDLAARWVEAVRDVIFLEAALGGAPAQEQAAAALALRRARERATRLRDGLARFGRDALEAVAPAYWASWAWLGQPRDAAFAGELFELAKPAGRKEMNLSEAVDDIRAARDLLDREAREGPLGVRPVAAVLLAKFAPQYRLARERAASALAAALAAAAPVDQQRITWALAVVTGRRFGDVTGEQSPSAVRHADVLEAARWIRDARLADLEPLRTAEDSYPRAPALARRVVSVARQAERDLLERLRGDWRAARGAVDAWLRYGIGLSPRLRAVLDPGQRAPHYPALAAAMVIVAESNATGGVQPLTIWAQAADQPPWVRSLAATALAALEARAGRPVGRWPAGLELTGVSDAGDAGPSWEDFARVIASGGPGLVERLSGHRPPDLPPRTHARLVAAARAALERRDGMNP